MNRGVVLHSIMADNRKRIVMNVVTSFDTPGSSI